MDGAVWDNPVTVQDALGNVLTLYAGNVASFQTPDTLRPAIAWSGDALISASARTSLSAAESTAARAIVGYRWTQLGGTPLSFGTPGSAQSTVSWGAAAPAGIELIPIELVITDAAGETEHTRLTITAANLAGMSRILYFRSTPGDFIGAGQTRVYSEGTGSWDALPVNSGYVALNYRDAGFPNGEWWSLTLGTADGAPLHIGSYEGAGRFPGGGVNGLDFFGTGHGCNATSGRYSVLDLQADTAGTITRLAVDFEQHCESPQSRRCSAACASTAAFRSRLERNEPNGLSGAAAANRAACRATCAARRARPGGRAWRAAPIRGTGR